MNRICRGFGSGQSQQQGDAGQWARQALTGLPEGPACDLRPPRLHSSFEAYQGFCVGYGAAVQPAQQRRPICSTGNDGAMGVDASGIETGTEGSRNPELDPSNSLSEVSPRSYAVPAHLVTNQSRVEGFRKTRSRCVRTNSKEPEVINRFQWSQKTNKPSLKVLQSQQTKSERTNSLFIGHTRPLNPCFWRVYWSYSTHLLRVFHRVLLKRGIPSI